MIKSFEDLEVYQRAINILVEVYKLAKEFPDYERYELGSQIRRASSSVPCNIAEGYGRKHFPKEFRKFLSIAMGSANEVVVHLEIAKRSGYVDEKAATDLQEEYRIIGKQLYTMLEK